MSNMWRVECRVAGLLLMAMLAGLLSDSGAGAATVYYPPKAPSGHGVYKDYWEGWNESNYVENYAEASPPVTVDSGNTAQYADYYKYIWKVTDDGTLVYPKMVLHSASRVDGGTTVDVTVRLSDGAPGGVWHEIPGSAHTWTGVSWVGQELTLPEGAPKLALSAGQEIRDWHIDIKNNGPLALSSEGVMVDYYLSNDTTFGDSDDEKIGDTGFTVSIASGGTYHIGLSSSGLGYMADDRTAGLVGAGNYYVFAKVRITSEPPTDPTSGNNYDRTSSTFSYNPSQQADMEARSVSMSLPSGNPRGQHPTALSYSLKNSGPANLSSSSYRIDVYLSSNAIISTYDTKIGDNGIGLTLNSGQTGNYGASSTGLSYFTIPSGMSAGTYYVGLHVVPTGSSPSDPSDSDNWIAGNQVTIP